MSMLLAVGTWTSSSLAASRVCNQQVVIRQACTPWRLTNAIYPFCLHRRYWSFQLDICYIIILLFNGSRQITGIYFSGHFCDPLTIPCKIYTFFLHPLTSPANLPLLHATQTTAQQLIPRNPYHARFCTTKSLFLSRSSILNKYFSIKVLQ